MGQAKALAKPDLMENRMDAYALGDKAPCQPIVFGPDPCHLVKNTSLSTRKFLIPVTPHLMRGPVFVFCSTSIKTWIPDQFRDDKKRESMDFSVNEKYAEFHE